MFTRTALEYLRKFPLCDFSFLTAVQCKARFQAPSFHVDHPIKVQVFLRVDCPHPVSFNKLAVSLSNQVTASHVAVCLRAEGQQAAS